MWGKLKLEVKLNKQITFGSRGLDVGKKIKIRKLYRLGSYRETATQENLKQRNGRRICDLKKQKNLRRRLEMVIGQGCSEYCRLDYTLSYKHQPETRYHSCLHPQGNIKRWPVVQRRGENQGRSRKQNIEATLKSWFVAFSRVFLDSVTPEAYKSLPGMTFSPYMTKAVIHALWLTEQLWS